MTSYKQGDLLHATYDNRHYVYKILRVDEHGTYHALTYGPSAELPTMENLHAIPVMIWHSPIGSFEGASLLGNKPVKEEELQGYFYYLKQVDFQRYAAETGQSVDEIISKANEAYRTAYALTDEKKYEEAIEKYTEAAELFPLFYEAIDNRAFVKMDLGRWQEAIEDFRWSLQVNPESVLAEFSIGECYMKMGDYTNAKAQFEKALQIDPEDKYAKEFLGRVNALLKQ